MISDRLQKEFAATCTSQTQEIVVNGEEWNDGLLATVRERVHMEAHRKTMSGDFSSGTDSLEKITYKVGNKVICCLEGARIGIQCKTFFAGEPCEIYYIVLQGKSFIEKMSILEHTVPFVLPMREVENDLLSSNGMKFIDHMEELLQAYLDRRKQVYTCHFLRVHLIKGLYGNQIGDLYSSLPFHMIEFMLDDAECTISVTLRYADLLSVLPTRARVLVWPLVNLTMNDESYNIKGILNTGLTNSHLDS
ncbi:hypothetical protein SAY87_023193 [Trapa incisa]|uniref:Centromere protein O n=1 Tax=Trapa incisa TaxID=236973 RepID=A0AAN7K5L1_9MYRT|nr:hypothetical protein SAY87_023193 [Trapa incisa]